MRFSPTTGCFYPDDIQYQETPSDLIEVPQEDFDMAMARRPDETLGVADGRVVVVPPAPPTDAQLIGAAKAKRDDLLAIATDAIAPLQDAIDLDIATPAETALLTQWKQYRVDVNRVQNQAQYPRVIDWPAPPSN